MDEEVKEEENELCTHHDHLDFSSCCSVSLDDIVEKDDLTQFHGDVIFCTINSNSP